MKELKGLLNTGSQDAVRLYKRIRNADDSFSEAVKGQLEMSMVSDMSQLSSGTSASSYGRFYKKWEAIITSGEEPSTHLNERATWMLPQIERDFNLQEIARLQKELSNLKDCRPGHVTLTREKCGTRDPFENVIAQNQAILT